MIEQSLGWIKLHRKLLDNPILKNPSLLRLWIYCLLKASYKKTKIMVGLQEVQLNPGEFIIGRYQLHNDLYPARIRDQSKWASYRKFQVPSPFTLWRWLKSLESMQFLSIKSNNKYSIVSIINWHTYQGNELENEQQTEQQVSNKRSSSDHQVITNKNAKNIKNVKNNNVQLSNLLKKLILQNNPKAKITDTQIKNWGNTIRIMIERDKRTVEEIESLIKFSQNDDFWKSNILSMDKLRKQFDRLTLQAKQKEPKKESEIIQKPEPIPQLTPEQIADNKKRLGKLIDSLN